MKKQGCWDKGHVLQMNIYGQAEKQKLELESKFQS